MAVVTGMLAGMGINRVPEHLGLAPGFRIARRDASELGGTVAMIAILFVGIAQASEVLGFAILTDAVAVLGRVLVHVAVALLVLGVGLWLASAIAGAIRSSGVANAGVVASVVRAALVFFTAALALLQAGLPAAIVTIAFGSVVGALAIGVAIAVGAGGRHVAKRLLERAADTMSRREQEPAGGAER